jgi:hypothetical protein
MAHDPNPDTLLRRRTAAEALSGAGYPIRPATLASMATRGGGPPFQRFGRVPLYRWGDLLAWAESRLSAPMRSTSEADAATRYQRRDHGDEALTV